MIIQAMNFKNVMSVLVTQTTVTVSMLATALFAHIQTKYATTGLVVVLYDKH